MREPACVSRNDRHEMRPRTIVISINSSWNVVNFRAGLVRALQRGGWSVVALTPSDAHAGRLSELGARHVALEMVSRGTSPLADLSLFLRYIRSLMRIRPDVYLGFTIKPNVFGSMAAHLLGIKVINNIAGLGQTFATRGMLNRIVRLLYKVALRRSSLVFFQNPDDRDLFVAAGLVAPNQTDLLPGSGVDLDRFSSAVPPHGSHARPFVFLMVTRLLKSKGIADFLEAGRILREAEPRVRLRILGIAQTGADAFDIGELQRWVDRGVLELLLPTDDVVPELSRADCVVLPTFYPEGTPRVLLEAAAMGLPLIASDTPGCRQIVRPGRNGYLFPARDRAALADCMAAITKLSRREIMDMGAQSRQIAEREFDERLVFRKYLDAIRRAMGAAEDLAQRSAKSGEGRDNAGDRNAVSPASIDTGEF